MNVSFDYCFFSVSFLDRELCGGCVGGSFGCSVRVVFMICYCECFPVGRARGS